MTFTAMSIAAEIESLMPIEEIKEEVNLVACEAAKHARTIAPVYHGDDPRATPGSYRDSIHAEETEPKEANGFDHLMPAARVITRSPIANLVEFGTKKMKEHAVFAQTADHYGGTVDVEKDDSDTGLRLD